MVVPCGITENFWKNQWHLVDVEDSAEKGWARKNGGCHRVCDWNGLGLRVKHYPEDFSNT